MTWDLGKHKNSNFNAEIIVESMNIDKGESQEKRDNLKFSAVLGAISAKSSILMRPAGIEPMVMSKNTTGFLGF